MYVLCAIQHAISENVHKVMILQLAQNAVMIIYFLMLEIV